MVRTFAYPADPSDAHSDASDLHDRVDHATPLAAEEIRQIIIKALEAAPRNRLQLCNIYHHIEKYFPKYIRKTNWQKRIRQQLTESKLFKKEGRGPGQSRYWRLQGKMYRVNEKLTKKPTRVMIIYRHLKFYQWG
ncbi:hypothetical protein DBV15_07144 [Temnothorax longispinosus]|uniref:Fork-head domain-containing protein n=1 Tax=Temnothorax longispinosus TaxID=300112 RepID=A0A4S2L7D7_9HYME|nr:hypothetical protein DBV15_07144 [Temnothorax longispinosus]